MSHITVNSALCNCGHDAWLAGRDNGMVKHSDTCASAPIFISCPIPRTVTFKVRLGECACTWAAINLTNKLMGAEDMHARDCPARPIRVSCSIAGKTWEESEVDISTVEPSEPLADRVKFMAACRERWALVKALVTGQRITSASVPIELLPSAGDFFDERDAVFAALANMARAEEAASTAQRALATHRLQARKKVHQARPEDRPSADYLAAYVERLIKQVGAL